MARSSSRPSTRKFWQAAQSLQSGFSRQGLYWLLRSGLVTGRKEPGGFLLPTVTLMLLVLSLVVGTLVFRTFNRTAEVIGQRQQRALYNAATPAIDRAKLKLEYLFEEAGLSTPPSDADLVTELENTALYDLKAQGTTSAETRLDLNGDGALDSAWRYTTDIDGDGDNEVVAYSILTRSQSVDGTIGLENDDAAKAAALVVRNGPINLQDRGTDCSNVSDSAYAAWEPVTSSDLRKAVQVHAVVLDVNAAGTGVDNAVTATLEMQQDRQASLGNRWGAWFRNDLELHPTSTGFRWNGAIHTEGSFMMHNDPTLYLVSSPSSCIYTRSASEVSMAAWDLNGDGATDFQGQFLAGRIETNTSDGGAIVDAYVPAPNLSGSGENRVTITPNTSGTNTIKDSVDNGGGKTLPAQIALNPITLFTEDLSEARSGNVDNLDSRDEANTDWTTFAKPLDDSAGTYNQRLFNDSTSIPFLDDTYRADDRLGPVVGYGSSSSATSCGKEICVSSTTMGNATTDTDLVQNDPLGLATPDEDGYGYDGYWERRARRTGVRIIVGQRLELGNATEWLEEDLDGDGTLDAALNEATDGQDYNGDGDQTDTVSEDQNGNGFLDIDPLYPPVAGVYSGTNMESRANEMRQWQTLRDNLAAAQTTAVYHYRNNNGYDYPVACLATTAHPGTEQTDLDSRSFNYVDTTGDGNPDQLLTDFYTGQGTNGIEFAPPFATQSNPASYFATEVENPNSSLRIALTNLAYFAGDPHGAFPAAQDSDDADNSNDAITTSGPVVHPYPLLTMWGDFSNLRRVVTKLEANSDATTYASLSAADKTTLHTATCTIGMLAYATKVKSDQFQSDVTNDTGNDFSALTSFYTNSRQLLDGTAQATVNTDCAVAKVKGKCPAGQETYSFGGASNPEIWQVASTGDTWTDAGLVCGSDDDTGIVLREQDGAWPWTNIPADGLDSPDPTQWTAAETKAFLSQFNTAQWACGLGRDSGAFSTSDAEAIFDDLKDLQTVIDENTFFQLDRDRALGFVPGSFSVTTFDGATYGIEWDSETGEVCYDSISGGSGSAGTCTYSNGFTTDITLTTGCNPDIVRDVLGGSGDGLNDRSVMIALALCGTEFETSTDFPIRFPSLFYLFPFVAHAHDGDWLSSVETLALAEEYEEKLQTTVIARDNLYAQTGNGYIYDSTGPSGVNYYKDSDEGTTRFYFRPVEDGLGGGTQNGVVDHAGETITSLVNYLAIQPRTATADWATPVVADTDLTLDTSRVNAIQVDSNLDGTPNVYWYPAFLDVGIFNSREQMSTRVLSIDLDLLRRYRFETDTGLATQYCTATNPTSDGTDQNGECWLPLPTLMEASGETTATGALIYAFREDAVREDAIARPTRADASGLTCATNGDAWTTTATAYVNTTATLASNGSGLDAYDFLMDATGKEGAFYDAPLNPCTGVSPKPVDFYADPDRRPHGFALRNGADLRRQTGASAYDTLHRPFTFVTDNLAYIWGDFNLHSTTGATQNLEEFESGSVLANDWSNFYTRTDRNNDFADAADNDADSVIDTWRVAEIVADGVTVLDNNFVPGFIAQGLMWTNSAGYNNKNSYGGLNILTEAATFNNQWVLEDGTVTGAVKPNSLTSPLKISREGFPIYQSGGVDTKYGDDSGRNTERWESMTSNKQDRISPAFAASAGTAYVNATIVSGITPSRANHPYGGLHNFLRLIGNWSGDTLEFSGSFLQLNFSKYSAPFAVNAWEAGTIDTGTSYAPYYVEPTRDWSYDVALQYAPAGTVAARLSAPSSDRSEFYRELAIDDPYVSNLLCAKYDSNSDSTPDTRVDPRLTDADCP